LREAAVTAGPALPRIAPGPPEGVGFPRQPPEFLKPGDLMESEVAGVGKLSNRCVEAGSPVPAG